MGPCNHQVLNSTIRSCYFVAGLWREASWLLSQALREDGRSWRNSRASFVRSVIGHCEVREERSPRDSPT